MWFQYFAKGHVCRRCDGNMSCSDILPYRSSNMCIELYRYIHILIYIYIPFEYIYIYMRILNHHFPVVYVIAVSTSQKNYHDNGKIPSIYF